MRERGHKILALTYRELQRGHLFLNGGGHGIKAAAQRPDLVAARKAGALAVGACGNASAGLCQPCERACQPARKQRNHRARARQHHKLHFPKAQKRAVARSQNVCNVVAGKQHHGRGAACADVRFKQHIGSAVCTVHAVAILTPRRLCRPGKGAVYLPQCRFALRGQRSAACRGYGSAGLCAARCRQTAARRGCGSAGLRVSPAAGLRRAGGIRRGRLRLHAEDGRHAPARIIGQSAAIAGKVAVGDGFAAGGHIQQIGFQRVALQQVLRLGLLPGLVQRIGKIAGQKHGAAQRERQSKHQQHGERQLQRKARRAGLRLGLGCLKRRCRGFGILGRARGRFGARPGGLRCAALRGSLLCGGLRRGLWHAAHGSSSGTSR